MRDERSREVQYRERVILRPAGRELKINSHHPSSLIPHPSSFIPHPSSFILHPSSFILCARERSICAAPLVCVIVQWDYVGTRTGL
jgi:hypothetical protein